MTQLRWAMTFVGVDDSHRRRQLLCRLMMVGDNHINTQLIGAGHGLVGGDADIDGHHHSGAVAMKALDGRRVQAITFAQATRLISHKARVPQALHALEEQRQSRGAVQIKVAVKDNQLLLLESRDEPIDGGRHAVEGKGIGEALQLGRKAKINIFF